MSSELKCSYEVPENLRGLRMEDLEFTCLEPRCSPRSGGISMYCVFHSPTGNKDSQDFTAAIQSRDNANYRGYHFPVEFDTLNLRLEGADFTDAKFWGHADFSGATFLGATNFTGTKFEKGAYFGDATFRSGVNFALSEFSHEAHFEKTHFLNIDPRITTLNETGGTKFHAVNFLCTKFKSTATFTNSEFKTTVSFEFVEFPEALYFENATFSRTANAEFLTTKFHEDCHFNGLHCQSRMTFEDCVFSEETDFRNANLQGPTRFIRCSFTHLARFGGETPSNSEERQLNTQFWEIDTEKVSFRNADLRNASFYHCYNLDKAEFSTCVWNKALKRNRVLFDELALRGHKPKWGSVGIEAMTSNTHTADEWERVENTYRDLRRNFEDRRDYAGASEFYVGEMEMRRLRKPRRQRQFLSLEAFYLHLSAYGENWWKPLIWLFVLLLLSTSVYVGSGIDPDSPTSAVKDTIRVCWLFEGACLTKNLSLVGQSFIHSLSVLTFLRVSVLGPAHWSGQLMAILQLLLSPILLTLSLLAIRRKLKR